MDNALFLWSAIEEGGLVHNMRHSLWNRILRIMSRIDKLLDMLSWVINRRNCYESVNLISLDASCRKTRIRSSAAGKGRYRPLGLWINRERIIVIVQGSVTHCSFPESITNILNIFHRRNGHLKSAMLS